MKEEPGADRPVIVCFSHVRWDCAVQRPQQLMSRFAAEFDVLFWEEARDAQTGHGPHLQRRPAKIPGIEILIPRLPASLDAAGRTLLLEQLLAESIPKGRAVVRWYYTPVMLAFSRRVKAACTVYDRRDGPTDARVAAAELAARERELMEAADLVFTDRYRLGEAKPAPQADIIPFPSAMKEARPPAPQLGVYAARVPAWSSPLAAASGGRGPSPAPR